VGIKGFVCTKKNKEEEERVVGTRHATARAREDEATKLVGTRNYRVWLGRVFTVRDGLVQFGIGLGNV
jgi:hypothetical protein